jgi:hypothetical protein
MMLSGDGARALLIGTGTHAPGCRLPDVPEIAGAVAALGLCLVDQCGLPPDQLRMVHDPATPAELRKSLAEIGPLASDVLLIYYTGHGIVSTDTGELLLATSSAADLSPDGLEDQALPFRRLARTVAQWCPARSVIIILDCCFASRAADPGAGWTLLKSSGWDEQALVPAGGRYPAYTGELIRVLTDGDPLGPPQLTVRNVHSYLARTLQRSGQPTPRASFGDSTADLILTANRAYRLLPSDGELVSLQSYDEDFCPYRGLDPYTASDARFFSGRRELTGVVAGKMAERLWTGGITLVVGASGSGKSSLLMGGMLPSISRGGLGVPGSSGWPRAMLTPGADPLAALARSVHEALRLPAAPGPERTAAGFAEITAMITDGLASWPGSQAAGPEPRLVVVIDQAEELFTICDDDEERRDFLRVLGVITARADDAAPLATAALVLRSDFFGACAGYPELRDAAAREPVLVGPMTSAELREAITEPAAAAGLRLEAGLADLMIEDIGADPADDGFAEYDAGALPLLSFALLGTWQRRQGPRLTLAGYQAAGRVAGAIRQAADDAYDELAGSPAQDAMRDLLLDLVSVGHDRPDTRRRRNRADLLAASSSPDATQSALTSLARHRLVSVDAQSVQISHEALIGTWPRLRAWIEQDRERSIARQELAERARKWDSAGRGTSVLYDRGELAAARALIGGESRGQPAEFLAASERYVRLRRRRAQFYVSLVVVVAVIAAISAVVAVSRSATAISQRNLAISRELIAEATALQASQPGLARQLLAQADRMSGQAAEGALLTSLAIPGVLAAPGTIQSVSYSRDRPWIALATGNTVRLADPVTGSTLATLRYRGNPAVASSPVDGAALSPGGDLLAVRVNGGVTLWDVTDPRRPAELTAVHVTFPATNLDFSAMSFSPDGHVLALGENFRPPGGHETYRISLWDITRPRHPVSVGAATLPSPVDTAAFSADGRVLVTVGDHADLWNVSGPRLIRGPVPVPGLPIALYGDAAAFSPGGRLLAIAGSWPPSPTRSLAASSRRT